MQTNKRKYMKCEETLDHLFDCCLFFVSQDLGRMIAKLADEAFAPTTLSPSYAILMMAVKEKGESIVQLLLFVLSFLLLPSHALLTSFLSRGFYKDSKMEKILMSN